eukprot:5841095-Prymnesium_polylepis.2
MNVGIHGIELCGRPLGHRSGSYEAVLGIRLSKAAIVFGAGGVDGDGKPLVDHQALDPLSLFR